MAVDQNKNGNETQTETKNISKNDTKVKPKLQKEASTYEFTDKRKSKKDEIPEKHFISRPSLLTELFANPHVTTVYHIFVALLTGLFVNTVAKDYLIDGKIHLGLKLIYLGFGQIHIALLAWSLFYTLTCLCYFAFIYWSKIRQFLPPKSPKLNLWDNVGAFLTLSYYIFSFRLAANTVTHFALPPASAAIVLIEQTRLLMKVHAFIRSNAPKVLRHKTHTDEKLILPTFQYFVFFTFVPTMVYRDEYPRTKSIRKKFVIYRFLEILAIIFYFSFVISRFLKPHYEDFGIRKFSYGEIILSLFENSITGIMILLLSFYMLLHCVQNLGAELLRFGDRMFYKDWWTVTNYAAWFRTWNVVVHDWLYTYLYKDAYMLTKSTIVAKLSVFMVSAIVHEWILTYMFGFFLPALFVAFFTFGTILGFVKFPKNSFYSVLFWYGLSCGSGLLVGIYGMEYYARLNTQPVNEKYDFYIPRFLTCDCFK